MAVEPSRSAKFRWWVGSTLSVAIAGPPAASFVLLPWVLLSASPSSAHSFEIPDYVIALLFLAIPASYVFGVVPALLTGATYSAALTAIPQLRAHSLLRSCLAAACGGFWAGIWFPAVIGAPSSAYVAAAALVMALLALRRPLSSASGPAISTRQMWLRTDAYRFSPGVAEAILREGTRAVPRHSGAGRDSALMTVPE